MLQWLIKLAKLILYKKTYKEYYMQKYIFKMSGLYFVEKDYSIFYLKMIKNATLIRKTSIRIPQVETTFINLIQKFILKLFFYNHIVA